MESNIAIEVSQVSKSFALPHERATSIKGLFIAPIRALAGKRLKEKRRLVLNNIDFNVEKGEFFGIVGRNGSGKSTLLKIIAGIYQPSKGSIKINGRLVPFIELGVGFNPELSGEENVYLNGSLLGFSRKEIDEKYDEIVDFAELNDYMKEKLKNYSSGMQVRLAFSVATKLAESDILLVDEVLAVGDSEFQKKCFEYFYMLKKLRKTVILVTHDMGSVIEYCTRAMLIDRHEVAAIGDPGKIATEYKKLFNGEEIGDINREATSLVAKRWGNRKAQITKVKLTPTSFNDETKKAELHIEVMYKEDLKDPVCGFVLKNAAGTELFGTNTKIQQYHPGLVRAGTLQKVSWGLPHILTAGNYTIDVAIQHNDAVTICDWWESAVKFHVRSMKGKTPYSIDPSVGVDITQYLLTDKNHGKSFRT